MVVPHDPPATGTTERLSVLVGVPDPTERARVSALLRAQGHEVIEAGDAGEMAESEDPALAARLASTDVARAVILLPSGGLLSTASRAQRLGASAVLPGVSALHRLRELLRVP
jgi:hypothetical protein